MAMAQRMNEGVQSKRPGEQMPSIFHMLGFTKEPNCRRWGDLTCSRIQWAMRVLRETGYGPAQEFEVDRYVFGPNSSKLQRLIEDLDWNDVRRSTVELEDERFAVVRDAIAQGDDFLLALSMAIGIHAYNEGITSVEIKAMLDERAPRLIAVTKSAIDFAEARIWIE
ncbi:MAG: hypothetical protein WCK39_08780 [Methanomassiliicoccales archaeon]